VHVAPDADEAATEAAARADARVGELLAGKTVRKVVVVPGRLVNFVVG
jgi:leucyl-tRNA synthetase